MARALNLQTTRTDDGAIKVSWDDTVKGDFTTSGANMYGLAAVGGFLLFTVLGFAAGVGWFFLSIPWMLGCISMMRQTKMKPNAVIFDKDRIRHGDDVFATPTVTRFEYGLRSQLTGQQPYRNPKTGDFASDPAMIRMWINDASAHIISESNWQNQVVHEIRDALDKALLAVRKEAVREEREATHGKTGDFGMPDY